MIIRCNFYSQDISKYGLYITEDDGEVDWDFPCLDPTEVIAKFEFSTLGLVEMKPSDKARHSTLKTITEQTNEKEKLEKIQEEVAKDLAKMQGHTTAMEAPLYQLYRSFSFFYIKDYVVLSNFKP